MKLGIDLVEIPRIKDSVEKYGDHFLKRILTDREIEYCMSKSNPYESIAARFACKEAFAKAVGTGISKQIGWHSIEVSNAESGFPTLNIHADLQGISKDKISISMSHTHKYAVAIVTIES